MRNDVYPFLIPGEDTTPELVGFVRLELAFERAAYGAEGEAEKRSFGAGDSCCTTSHMLDASREKGANEVGASDVDV